MEDRVGENNEAGRDRGKEGDGGGWRGGMEGDDGKDLPLLVPFAQTWLQILITYSLVDYKMKALFQILHKYHQVTQRH